MKRKSGRYGDAVVLLGDGHALPHIDIHFGHVLLEARDESGVLRTWTTNALSPLSVVMDWTHCAIYSLRGEGTPTIYCLFVDSVLILC